MNIIWLTLLIVITPSTGGDIEYHIKNKLPIAKAKGDKSEKESVNFFVSILEDMREAEKIAEKFVVKADES